MIVCECNGEGSHADNCHVICESRLWSAEARAEPYREVAIGWMPKSYDRVRCNNEVDAEAQRILEERNKQ